MSMTFTIDGKKIKAKSGMTILEAAKRENIYIPTLCDHQMLRPAGSCRLCIVEIEGMRGYPTSCTTPIEDGMVVQTETPKLRAIRKSILELTLSEHPYTCLVCSKRDGCDDYMGTIRKVGVTTGCQYCPKNGSCELQHLVDTLGVKEIAFPITYRSIPVEGEDPFFDRDYNLCILCGRCVRMCDEVRRNGTLTFGFRGEKTVVGTAFGKSHLDTGCEFCGACVDVCPTGALYDKRSKWEGCPEKTKSSLCPYCGVGCSLCFHLSKGEIVSTTPSLNGTLNQGQICVRGRFGVVDVVHHSKRLTKPMMKKDGRWVETTWDEALDVVAEQFAKVRGDRFAMIATPQCTVEDAYVFQKFVRTTMKGSNIALSSDFSTRDIVESLQWLRSTGITCKSMDNIDSVGTIILWGADISKSHPIVSLKLKQAQKRGAQLIVVDSRRTKLTDMSDLHIQLKPGTDRALITGLLKLFFDELGTGKISPPGIGGMETVKKAVKRIDLSAVETGTGVSRGKMEALADQLSMKGTVLFIIGPGFILQDSFQEDLKPLTNLAMLVDDGMILPVLGESNFMGCIEMGCQQNLLPGNISIKDEGSRRNYEKKWGVSLKASQGYELPEIVKKMDEGKIDCLYLTGELPKLDCLKKLKFIVVQSLFAPEWMEWANVVLPVAHLNETEGTMMNFEGRIQRLSQISRPLADSRPDWWICSQIAQKLNGHGFDFKKSKDVFDELSSLIPGYDDLTPGKLGKKGQIPWHRRGGNEKERQLFKFNTRINDTESVKGFPFTFLIGWNLSNYRNGIFVEMIPGMEKVIPDNHVEMHPQDAEKRNIVDGDKIRMRTSEGDMLEGRVVLSANVPRRVVYMPISRVNSALDFYGRNQHFIKIEKGTL